MADLFIALIIVLPIAWFTFGMKLLEEAIKYWPRAERDPFPHVRVTEIRLSDAFADFTGSEETHA